MAKPNLADYVTVAERIGVFYEKYPDGSLQSELIFDDGERVVMKSSAFRTPEDPTPAIGHAEEIRGDGPINKTSALENCETSSAGRALAMLGLEVKKGIASREEVEQALAEEQRQQNGHSAAALRARIKDLGLDVDECKMKLTSMGVEKLDDLSGQQRVDFEAWLNAKADALA